MKDLNRRDLLGLMAAGATSAALPRLASPFAANERPNILYIMADDHASHAISAYGSKINKTPNIDRIATGGMRMNNCFCTNSICTPSRGAIITGQYSQMNGVYTLADELDGSHQNVAKLMKAGGYRTGMIGKWHLKQDPTGFDYWNILPGQGVYQDPTFIEMGQKKQHQGYVSDLIADFSLDFLKKRDKKQPFFLMCHHKAPHRNWQPGAKWAHMYDGQTIPEPFNLYDHYENRSRAAANTKLIVGESMNEKDVKRPIPPDLKGDALRKWAYQYYIKDYLRCVASVDDNVGRLLDYLDAEGLAKNTIVIYTSDQGFFLGDHGYFDKRFMYEESLRMPFLVRYPGHIRAGSTNDDIVLNIDFAETFLDYAGLKIPSDMQGRSFRPVLEGHTPKDWRQSMYYRYWMHMTTHGVPAHYGIRTKQYKLIYYYGAERQHKGAVATPTEPEWELFDMVKDPHEMKNLYNDPAYAGVIQTLKAEMDRLQKYYKDTPA
ncbi:MAG: sulfatase [Acidobacteria bacterium]|nr:sulfatase [Acidobacteriota bacterium]